MSIRSIFIPTPQVEQFSNYYLVQLLAKERVRCVMTGEKFADTSLDLVQKYLTIPTGVSGAQEETFFKNTAKEVLASFKLLEAFPTYAEGIVQLKNFEGYKFEINSVTVGGIMVLFETPAVSVA